MKALQIVGRKKVGKTTFVIRLIPLLGERGLRVGSVKHTRNPYPLDRPGTDSQRHREAGAQATLVLTATHGALHFPAPEDPAAAESLVSRLLGEFDLVLIEGWRGRRGPRIEILAVDAEGRPDPLEHPDPSDLLAVVLGPRAPAAWIDPVLRGASPDASREGTAPPGPRAGTQPAGESPGVLPRERPWPAVPVFAWDDVEGVRDMVMAWTLGGRSS